MDFSWLRKQSSATSYRFAFIFAFLISIFVMLAMASLYMHAYRALEREAQLRLESEWIALQRFKDDDTIEELHARTILFIEPNPLPTLLAKRLSQSPVFLQDKMIRSIGWHKHGITNDTLVSLVLRNNRQIIVAATIDDGNFLQELLYNVLYLFGVVVAIVMIYSYIINSRVTRRIERIDDAAKQIMQGDFNKRIPVRENYQDEYTNLSLTLNAMLEKIQTLMRDLRQVNNNIAHDLKSPLNRLRSRLEVSLMQDLQKDEYENVLAQSIDDVDALLQTFNALLLMGNLDSKSRNYQLKPTSLTNILSGLGELYETVAEEKSHEFHSQIHDEALVYANKNLLAQAISNLLDNAVKYTPEGGKIGLELKIIDAMALIYITDNGPGIPAEEKENVFERFTRLDQSRQLPGTGLGMALVRSILSVHSASIQLHDNQPGVRVEIRMRLANV